jgi:Amt family ammonium transporter
VARLVRVQPGLDAQRARRPLPEVLLVTQLAAARACWRAVLTAKLKTGTIDIGMAGNGAIAALVAITAPSGYVELWAAPIIGASPA